MITGESGTSRCLINSPVTRRSPPRTPNAHAVQPDARTLQTHRGCAAMTPASDSDSPCGARLPGARAGGLRTATGRRLPVRRPRRPTSHARLRCATAGVVGSLAAGLSGVERLALPGVRGGLGRSAAVQVAQLRLEVGPQPGPVLPLGGSQLLDLQLQAAALLIQPTYGLPCRRSASCPRATALARDTRSIVAARVLASPIIEWARILASLTVRSLFASPG